MRLSATGDETAPESRQLDGCWYILDGGNLAASSAGSLRSRAVVESRDWTETGPVTGENCSLRCPRRDLAAAHKTAARPGQQVVSGVEVAPRGLAGGLRSRQRWAWSWGLLR
jgi:hypothetical protein